MQGIYCVVPVEIGVTLIIHFMENIIRMIQKQFYEK